MERLQVPLDQLEAILHFQLLHLMEGVTDLLGLLQLLQLRQQLAGLVAVDLIIRPWAVQEILPQSLDLLSKGLEGVMATLARQADAAVAELRLKEEMLLRRQIQLRLAAMASLFLQA